MRRRDVRPPSEGERVSNKKPAADGSARAFDISSDDGLIQLICPTCQVQFRYLRNLSGGNSGEPSISLSPAPGRKQPQKPVFILGRSRLRKAKDRCQKQMVHRLAADESR